MAPYFTDDWLTVYLGDCREVMAGMAAESVHCVVTSPPYWGLRDYGTSTWVGGDEACDHLRPVEPRNARPKGAFHGGNDAGDMAREPAYKGACRKCGAVRQDAQLGLEPTPEQYVENMVAVFREVRRVLRSDGTVWLNLGDSYAQGGQERPGSSDAAAFSPHDQIRRRPGIAKPRAAGLKTKDLVGIPWRVAFALQADGWVLRSEVIWAKPNPMPESVTDRPTKSHEQMFLFSKGKRIGPDPTKYDDISDADAQWIAGLLDCEGSIVIRREPQSEEKYGQHAAQMSIGSTSRALLERVAAIVGEGNVLERDGQNAPMHYWQLSHKRALGLLRRLYPFLIVKQAQARCAIALEERKSYRGGVGITKAEVEFRERCWQAVKSLNHFGLPDLDGIPEPVFGRWTSQPYYFDADAVREEQSPDSIQSYERAKASPREAGVYKQNAAVAHIGAGETVSPNAAWSDPEKLDRLLSRGRNIRSVWTVATQPYPGAHFATFPPKLVEPCIKAGTSEKGVCPECGAPWERVVERTMSEPERSGDWKATGESHRNDIDRKGGFYPEVTTTGWRSMCDHKDPWLSHTPVPATVLDPFAGSGTTGMVAQSLSRRAVLIDLNADYLDQVLDRNRAIPLGLGA